MEDLAIRRLPGLKQTVAPGAGDQRGAVRTSFPSDCLNRLARALLDDEATTGTPIPGLLRAAPLPRGVPAKGEDTNIAWGIGWSLLTSSPSSALPSLRHRSGCVCTHRDDNRYFWAFEEFDFDKAERMPHAVKQVRKYVIADGDGQRGRGRDRRRRRPGNLDAGQRRSISTRKGATIKNWKARSRCPSRSITRNGIIRSSSNARPGRRPARRRAKSGDQQIIDAITAQYKREIHRMENSCSTSHAAAGRAAHAQAGGRRRDRHQRRRSSFIDIRLGRPPRPAHHDAQSVRRPATSPCWCCSTCPESTNENGAVGRQSILGLTRQACVLLSRCDLRKWAIHSPCTASARTGGATSNISVQGVRPALVRRDRQGRLGRHERAVFHPHGRGHASCGGHITLQLQKKKLIMVITDGEPADIDVRDPSTCATTPRKRWRN